VLGWLATASHPGADNEEVRDKVVMMMILITGIPLPKEELLPPQPCGECPIPEQPFKEITK